MTISVNRRTVLTGTVALGTVGLLAACGSKKDNSSLSGSGASNAEEAYKNININEQPHSNLKQGGELRLSIAAMGPNFNTLTQSGYTSSNIEVLSAINIPSGAGFYNTTPRGDSEPNSDFISDYKAETKDGVQVVTYRINKRAKFNDGTPIDIDAVQAFWDIYKGGSDAGYQLYDDPAWQNLASLEAVDGDKYHIKATSKTPWYPADGLYARAVHPALKDKDLFNEGFNNKIDDKYFAGPYRLDNWDSSAKVMTLKPNENWWGENKGVLDKIIWRQLDAEAQRAAIKNDEIDALGFTGAATYQAVKDIKNTEIRNGQSIGVKWLELNPASITDLQLRRAVFAAVDREQLAKPSFTPVGWSEKVPGSNIAMAFQRGYNDNFAAAVPESGPDAAKKILEAAGYAKSGDYYAKDGKTAEFAVTTFGSDPITNAVFQALEGQMKAAGIKVTNDVQPVASSNSIIGTKQYAAVFSGLTIATDPANTALYIYDSTYYRGIGDPEIDEICRSISTVESRDEQLANANKAEKLHNERVAIYIPYGNGPSYMVVKKGLANYGPSLFKMAYNDASYWTMVGWQK